MIKKNKRRRKTLQKLLNTAFARRRKIIEVGLFILFLTFNIERNKTVITSCRRFVRNGGWWETVWIQYSDERFKKTCRVSRYTFQCILGKIRHKLEKENVTEAPISPEQRLGIFQYRCARVDYHCTIAEMVGLGVSTTCSIVSEVAEVIVEILWDSEVTTYMPKSETEFYQKMNDMDQKWQFPCCWGAIDGCHIPIKCPPGGSSILQRIS